MKPRISRLTLELYHRGLATRKERKLVEKALLSDNSVRERYEALKESEREINQFVSKELNRLDIPQTPSAVAVHSVNMVWVIATAAILIIALVPVFLHLRSNSLNKNNTIAESQAEETGHETIIIEENKIAEETFSEDNTSIAEQSTRREMGSSNDMTRGGIAVTPHPESADFQSGDFQSGGTAIASIPTPDTGVWMRGQNSDQQSNAITPPELEDNSGIPPGLTFIFENMFANKWMVGIVIPDRITSIAKNAYAGNPVLVVNIGANVDVHDEAIPGNFAKAYNSYGKAAGIYQRPNSNSEDWKKLEF
jgi:hypothetical protein